MFTVHRSGSTLLGRLLNCHPDLVVWGEHSGLVNSLAEIDFLVRHNQDVLRAQGGDNEWLEKFASDAEFRSSHLQPWTMPPHLETTKDHAKQMIRSIFSRHLRPGQRWGFKEIRYHRPYIADYLLDLFPEAKIVLLHRDVPDAAVSNILVDWSQEGLKAGAGEETQEWADEVVRDVVYALLAFRTGFKWMKHKYPATCFEVNYNALNSKDITMAEELFRFVGLEMTPQSKLNIEKAFNTKFNVTQKVPKISKILTADFIRQRAAEMVPGLQAEIDTQQVDRARLASGVSPGKYSFLVGAKRSAYIRF